MSKTKIKADIKYQVFTKIDLVSMIEKQQVAEFLFQHLDEYGNPKADILRAIEYAVGDHPFKGGFVLVARDHKKIVGAVVMNQTHMGGYIPENILVYIAVDKSYRGHGIGKQLMANAIDFSSGDIALHVEPNNPALHLYEKLGFENKYLEMRFTRKK